MIDGTEHPIQEKNVPQRYFFLTGGMPYDKNIKKGLHVMVFRNTDFPSGFETTKEVRRFNR